MFYIFLVNNFIPIRDRTNEDQTFWSPEQAIILSNHPIIKDSLGNYKLNAGLK